MKYIAIDTETSGIEPGSRLTQIGAVADNRPSIYDIDLSAPVPDEPVPIEPLWRVLQIDVDPCMPIPPDITRFNGYDDARAAVAQPTGLALAELVDWIGGPTDEITLVMHNAPFDCAMLLWSAARAGFEFPDYRVIDTLEIARALKVTRGNSLDELIKHYGIEMRHGPRHSAAGDAGATLDYFDKVWPMVEGLFEPKTVRQHAAVHGYRYTANMPDGFEALPYCVLEGEPFAFVYTDEKDERTTRVITPYGWALREVDGEERFYFHGYCHTREARRTFRADRAQPLPPPA